MRLAKNVVQEREAFLTEMFKNDPTVTAKTANEALKTKYGTYMRLQRVYEIKRDAVKGAPVAPVAVAEVK
jgi:hypothetical protein